MEPQFHFTDEERQQLLRNGRCSMRDADHDPIPVMLLRRAGGTPAWLLAEVDPSDPDLAFGLFDPGDGVPTLGTVRLSALELLPARGVEIARDLSYQPITSLGALTIAAYRAGHIP